MMKKHVIHYLVIGILLTVFSCALATDNYTTNPKWNKHWWLDVTAGYSDFAFTNADLAPGFHARSVTTNSTGFRGELGYNFNDYLAIELSLMRGVNWVQYHSLIAPNDWHSVWNSLFGLTLRPTLPLGRSVGLYGEAGLGYISRHGFSYQNTTVVTNDIVLTPLFGTGFIFNVWQDLFIDLNAIYSLPNTNQQQPQTWYTGLGLFYLLGSNPASATEISQWFAENLIQLNYMNKSIFDGNIADSIYLPIFFTSDITVEQGLSLIYERNVFHTSKVFSLELGASLGNWTSSQLQQNFTTVSIFPEIKLWLVRCPRFDLYFTYSLAGPTIISRKRIDNYDTGTNFTFEDFIGFGTYLGKAKHFNMNIQLMHFSNGNLFPENPGVDVPLMFGLGYSF
jgi:hypothetical protein